MIRELLKDLLHSLLRKLPRPPRRVRQFLSHAGLSFVYVTLIGALSNLTVLIAGYIITLPHLFEFILGYYMEYDNQKLWLIYLTVSQVFCTVGCGWFLSMLGSSSARYRFWYGLNADRPDIPVMLTGIGTGIALHGLLCAFVTRVNMAYLFFAGPVQYIARFIARGDRSLFVDVAFQFPRHITLLAIVIYCILLFAGGCAGYLLGYKKQYRTSVEEEEARRLGEAPEKTWSDEDAKQTPSAYREKR